MRVLQVITDTDRRGAQKFAVDLNDALDKRHVQVETVALERGSDHRGFDVPVLGPSRTAAATLRALRAHMSRSSVVVGHGSTTLYACALASVGTGVPFVYR